MYTTKKRHILLLVLAGLLLVPSIAMAVPPPDFIVNAGMQIYQAVGIAIFFCSTGLAAIYNRFSSTANRTVKFGLIGLGLIGGGTAIYYFLQ